jgi:hypothetical protein
LLNFKPEFLQEWREFRQLNHVYTYQEKQKIWKLTGFDWTGSGKKTPYIPSCKGFEDFHKSPARYRTINSPRQNGKSLASVFDVGPMTTDPRGDVRGCFLAEEKKLAEQEWHYLCNFIFVTDVHEYLLEQIEKQLVSTGVKGAKTLRNEAKKRIKEKSNPLQEIHIKWPTSPETIIEVRSYNNPSKWRKFEGIILSWIISCEGSQLPQDFWNLHAKKRISRKGGIFINPSTPTGEDEFMHPMYQMGLSEEYVIDFDYDDRKAIIKKEPVKKSKYHVCETASYLNSYESFHILGTDNPHFPREDYEADLEMLFDGELDENIVRERDFGQYVSRSGKFFNLIPDGLFVNSKDRPLDKDYTNYIGTDIGSVSPSSSIWCAVEPPDEDGKEMLVVHKELYDTYGYAGDLAEDTLKMNNDRPIQRAVGDARSMTRNSPASHKTAEQIMWEVGYKCFPTPPHRVPHTKLEQYTKLKHLFLSKRVIIYEDKCPNLVAEIKAAEYKARKFDSGHTVQVDDLAKRPDHALTALIFITSCKPYWVKPNHIIQKEMDKNKPERNSMNYFLERDKKQNKRRTMFSGIGL